MDLTQRPGGERYLFQQCSLATWKRSLEAAEGWQRPHLRVMHELLEDMIERFYDGRLSVPILRVAATGDQTRPALYRSAPWTVVDAEIVVNPRVLDGTLLARYSERGARRYLGDVLLHELVHHWQTLSGYEAGHGVRFASECNRIGRVLGLPAVRGLPAGESGDAQPDGRYPACSAWPRCVRPAGYYQQQAEAWPEPHHRTRTAPLTAADRAWVVFQLDRERAAKADRRNRMRRQLEATRRACP